MLKHKICNKCRLIKSITEFHKNPRATHGRNSQCRTCRKASRKKARSSDNYYAQNSEKVKAASRAWRKRNPEKVAASNRRRRQLKAEAEFDPDVTNESLRESQGDQCIYCGSIMNFDTSTWHEAYDPTHVTVEHVVALVNGGGWTFDNCFLACRACNSSRRHRNIPEWLKLSEEDIVTCKELARLAN